MRKPHIQTIYLCNVYPFCLSSKIHYHVFFTLPISNSLLPEHYKDIFHTVYIFIKIPLTFSKCMNVFNLSEEAVNRCKALISVFSWPPSLSSILTHSLFLRDLGVSRQGLTHPEKANKLASEHEGGKKCLHLYKLACSIKGKVKKCWHLHWVNENSRWGDGGGMCEFKSDVFFPFSLRHIIQALWLHYQNVSHLIPWSCPIKNLHLPNTCQAISTLFVLMSWIHSKTQGPEAEMYKVLSDVF